MHRSHHRPAHQHRKKGRAFWFDFGRVLFPELINHPRAMQWRMLAITLVLTAMLVGALVGIYRRANDPADVLLIQARELHK